MVYFLNKNEGKHIYIYTKVEFWGVPNEVLRRDFLIVLKRRKKKRDNLHTSTR